MFNALSPVNSPTGVVASARIPSIPSSSLLAPSPALVVAATGLQDPGNAGAIIRSAAAAGATGVVLDELSADPWGWKALARIDGRRVSCAGRAQPRPLGADRRMAPCQGVRIVATVPRRGDSMYDVDFKMPTALLLGGEGSGLSDAIMATADQRVSIPMHGAIESLNAAVAAAVLLYEAQRQRNRGGER